MISAIDTNVLLDILIPNEAFADAATAIIEDAANQGSLVVCDIVYAEICIQFPTRRECDHFFDSNENPRRTARPWRALPGQPHLARLPCPGRQAQSHSPGLSDRRSRPDPSQPPDLARSRFLPQPVPETRDHRPRKPRLTPTPAGSYRSKSRPPPAHNSSARNPSPSGPR